MQKFFEQRRRMFCAVAIAAAGAFPAAAFAKVTVGEPAPAFTLTGADGKAVSLESLRGKTVVLEWTNHDCPFVRKHYDAGNMQAQQKDAAAAGAVWLQVVSSAPGKQGFVDGATANSLNTKRNAAPAGALLEHEVSGPALARCRQPQRNKDLTAIGDVEPRSFIRLRAVCASPW
jgi:hypothetical protein